MVDPYCYEDTPILRNTLDIRDEKTLDLICELSSELKSFSFLGNYVEH